MTFKDLMAMKRVSDPQISSSGKWVMFSVTDVSLEANTKVNHLWVVPIGGSTPQNPERQITFSDKGVGETNGRFSPDGKSVSATSDGQIVVDPWDEAAGTMKFVGMKTTVAGGLDGAIWSPDSKRLLAVAQVYPECSDKATWLEEDACDAAMDAAADKSLVKAQVFTGLLYRHWNAYTGYKRSHVLVMDADGTHLRDLTPRSAVGDAETPTFSLGGPLGYAWAPDSHEVAYVTNLDVVKAASTNNDVFTLRLDESGAKALKVSTSLGSDDGPQYSPDGIYLAFRSQARAGYESDRFRLMLYNRGTMSTREAFPKFDGWVDEYLFIGNEIYLTSPRRGEEPFFIGRDVVDPADSSKVRLDGEISDIRVMPGRKGIVAVSMRADHAAELTTKIVGTCDRPDVGCVWGGKNATDFGVGPLTHINDSLVSQLDLSPLESFEFAGAGGTKVQGFLVKPPNFDPAKKYPVKFLIHGGPQGAWGDAWSYRWNPELMAASGYVVVMVNPRGSTGYGQKFVEGVSGDWGGKAYVDLMKGLDAAEAQFPFIDKSRECALGASYGGYMANWILTHADRFRCIVTHDGMYNPVSAYGTTEELWFNEWEFRRAEDFPSGTNPGKPAQPWRYASLPADQDPFRKWSPAAYIQNAKTPTLVIHGQRDYRLDVSEGFQLFTALQRLGVPSKMLYFPDEGHWVTRPQNSELWNKTVSDWCDKWTHTNAYAGK